MYGIPALPSDLERASSKLRAGTGLHCSTGDSLPKTRTNLDTERLEDLRKTPVKTQPTNLPHISVPVQMLKPPGGERMRLFIENGMKTTIWAESVAKGMKSDLGGKIHRCLSWKPVFI